ncbi:MAG: septum formation initiator family protein [Parcubacteria group bacterium]|nr:septum formation initiator family protein [Parcubacteria group bacterium]
MRLFFAIFFLVGVSAFLAIQSIQLFNQEIELRKELSDLSTQTDKFRKENEELKIKIDYLSYPENLEKELRKLDNLKRDGEHLIIIVPDQKP